MSSIMNLESVQADMSDDEFNFSDFFYSSSEEEDISDDSRFEEVILTTISSVVGEMFDGMFEDSFTTPKRRAFSLDFVTVRVSN